MQILDGLKVSKELLDKLKSEVVFLKEKHIIPKIAVVLVGKDPASLVYIRQKQKACNEIGVNWIQHDLEETVSTRDLIDLINELNEDVSIHGILVQLPLPKHIFTPDIIKAIRPAKDVDGFTSQNTGKMFLSKRFEEMVPCTPLGVVRLFEYYGIEVAGKNVVMVGHSNIVGKPLAMMLLNRGATLTICHSLTENLADFTKKADILCVAVGKPNLITGDMVKKGAVVVDIGINHLPDGKICGDCEFETVQKKAGYLTPVPGGAGVMTVYALMENLIRATKLIHKIAD